MQVTTTTTRKYKSRSETRWLMWYVRAAGWCASSRCCTRCNGDYVQAAAADRQEMREALVFYPTLEEFNDPIGYLRRIEPVGSEYGVVKVIPPPGWSPPDPAVYPNRTFETKRQHIHRLQVWAGTAALRLRACAAAASWLTLLCCLRPARRASLTVTVISTRCLPTGKWRTSSRGPSACGIQCISGSHANGVE